MNYNEFILSKQNNSKKGGIVASDFNPLLKPFQRFSVDVALRKGQFALFEDCGLGKTFQQLEFGRHVAQQTQKPVLTLAPLAVTGQTVNEGRKFGIDVSEVLEDGSLVCSSGIHITNYEQIHKINADLFSGIVLDESSILKNFEGAYRNDIIEGYRNTPFKLACSATPSPNDPMELGNHSEFLGVMNRQEMLATYFVHDGGETSKWRLKGHAIDTFWKWVNTWSLMFSKPSDIGFADAGYELPALKFIEKQIKTEQREGKLFNDVAISATNFHREVRLTRIKRLDEISAIVNYSDDSFIIWVEQNEEGDALEKMIPGAIQVKGSDKDSYKKDKLLGFANNEFRVLITKGKIAGLGMNYQNCHNQIFASPDYSFEKIYQAVRRSFRYGQMHTVNIYLITTDTMQNVIETFKRKQLQHFEMQIKMTKYTNEIYYDQFAQHHNAT